MSGKIVQADLFDVVSIKVNGEGRDVLVSCADIVSMYDRRKVAIEMREHDDIPPICLPTQTLRVKKKGTT